MPLACPRPSISGRHQPRLAPQFGVVDLDPAIPPPPLGALAGGPTSQAYPDFPDDPRLPDLQPQRAYFEVPSSETTNDICIRWNAPLVRVATFLSLAQD